MHLGVFVLEVFNQNMFPKKAVYTSINAGPEMIRIPGNRLLVTVLNWNKEPLPNSPLRQ